MTTTQERRESTRRLLEKNEPASKPGILIRMPNWLGDCIMALPAVKYIHDSIPDAEIALAGRDSMAELLSVQYGVSQVVKSPESGVTHLIASVFSSTDDSVKPFRADLGVLFTNSLSTAVWMWNMGVKNRLGYNLDARRFFLTHPVVCDKRNNALHFVDYYLHLAKRVVKEVKSWQNSFLPVHDVLIDDDLLQLDLHLNMQGKKAAADLLAEIGVRDHYAVIAPASAYGPVKDWPPEYYRELVRTIVNSYDLPVIVTGGTAQYDVCQAIADDYDEVYNLAGRTTLGSFLGLLAGASLFVGGDSGGAHAAAALGVPTLVIFGITNPARTFPTGRNVSMLGRGSREAIKLNTPEAKAMAEEALQAISVEDASDAVELMIG